MHLLLVAQAQIQRQCIIQQDKLENTAKGKNIQLVSEKKERLKITPPQEFA